MLPAGPQAMRTGAEESEARIVMLHKQDGLFRIIVQNLHEKVSDRSDTRGAGILYARQRRQGVPVRRRPTIARQEPTAWPMTTS
jgi:hypothetical protein